MRSIIENNVITQIINDGCTTLFIPEDAHEIDEVLLYGGWPEELETIEVAPQNTHFVFVNRCLIHKDTHTLVMALNDSLIPTDQGIEVIGTGAFGNNTTTQEIIIPDSVWLLEASCFSNSCIKKITLPPTVELVRGNAFGICPQLSELIVLGAETEFEISAFAKLLNDGRPMPKAFLEYLNPNLVIEAPSPSFAEECAKINSIQYKELTV